MISQDSIMEILGLAPGMTVMTIGRGGNDFSQPISDMLGKTGKLHSMDASEGSTPLADHSCDRIILTNPESHEGGELRQAARWLRSGGRLFVVAQQGAAPPFRDMVRALEANTWTIHRHYELSPNEYVIEAAVTDESVQS